MLTALADAPNGLSKSAIEKHINARVSKIDAALRFLLAENPSPIVKQGSRLYRTPVDYTLPHETIQRLSERKRAEWHEMQEYLRHKECLMLFLTRSLDDELAIPCGKCANCAPEDMLERIYSKNIGIAAAEFVRQSEVEISPKRISGRSNEDAAARFPTYRFDYKFGELEHQPGRVLSQWGDSGWSSLVRRGKRDGHFDNDLVHAITEMIQRRWNPHPRPTWVTCVPSLRHKDLVPDFTQRLASQLGLTFIEAVHKIQHSEPQKNMENAYHRCSNLDGTLEIGKVLKGEPVFLLDDAVDSGWTFAIVSALLIRAGSGPVFPVALVSTG